MTVPINASDQKGRKILYLEVTLPNGNLIVSLRIQQKAVQEERLIWECGCVCVNIGNLPPPRLSGTKLPRRKLWGSAAI